MCSGGRRASEARKLEGRGCEINRSTFRFEIAQLLGEPRATDGFQLSSFKESLDICEKENRFQFNVT